MTRVALAAGDGRPCQRTLLFAGILDLVPGTFAVTIVPAG